MDGTERYFLYPDYAHEYDDNEDREEVTSIFLPKIFLKSNFH